MDERTRILKLVESGVITAEEAISLLEALSKEKAPQQTVTVPPTKSVDESVVPAQEVAIEVQSAKTEQVHEEATGESFESFGSNEEQQQKTKRTTGFEEIFGKAFNNKKMEQVVNDIRDDITEFSDRMMTFMNTTLSRVKSGEVPFGEKIEFEKIFAFPEHEVKSFEIDIPNGKINFVKADDEQVMVKTFVKTPASKSENIDVEAQFLESFAELKDGKLEISTSSKLSYVELVISVPEKEYDVIVAKLLSGAVTLTDVSAKLIKTKTYNGGIIYEGGKFDHVDFQTVNGSIEVRFVEGADLEANTANGRVYIDGKIKEIEAESVNGHVVVTTSSNKAHKVKASTLAGSVELYLPKNVSLEGTTASNFGKVDVQLTDAQVHAEEDQFLRKTIHFNKIEEGAKLLKVNGESRTGSVIVRYTTTAE